MGRARDLANILSSSGNVALDSEMGLTLITPTSVAVTTGTSSISTSGGVSFTNANNISFNGVFNSTYDTYKIVYNFNAIGGSTEVQFRFRETSTDYTSNWYGSGLLVDYTGGTASSRPRNNGSTGSIGNVGTGDSNSVAGEFIAQRQLSGTVGKILGLQYNSISTGPVFFGYQCHGMTNITGFTLIGASVNITGTIKIYGYRN
jgi:hypothetical protein